MLREKSAQGMSITVIIAAVIGLIVLVVVVAVLTGKLGGFSKGVDAVGGDITKKCAEIGGTLSTTDSCSGTTSAIVSKDSIATGKPCCK